MLRSWFPWLLPLLLLAACTVGTDAPGADATDAAADAADTAADAPDAAADALDKDPGPAPDATDAGADTDVSPAQSWTITSEASEPTTDAWLRVKPVASDPVAGTVTVAIEASAFANVLGLSFHLGFDPDLAEVVTVTKIFEPPTTGSTTWSLLARSTPGAVQGGLGAMRSADSLFGGGGSSQLSGSLDAPTVLVEVRLQLKAPGTLALSLTFADTVAVSPAWASLPLERLGLTVSASQGVDHE